MNMRINRVMDDEAEEDYIFSDGLEEGWRRSAPRYTEQELVEIYSPPREMIQAKLEERSIKKKSVTRGIKRALKKLYALEIDDLSHWFGELVIKTFLFPDLEKCNRHIARLKRILNIINPQKLLQSNRESVDKARQYPIYEIAKYRLLLKECGNKFSSLCPYHDEKHASFYIYPETNTFHCFGCQEHGDTIKLAMHLYGDSFQEAVRRLQ